MLNVTYMYVSTYLCMFVNRHITNRYMELRMYFTVLFIYIFIFWGTTPNSAQVLLLALHSGIMTGGLGEHMAWP